MRVRALLLACLCLPLGLNRANAQGQAQPSAGVPLPAMSRVRVHSSLFVTPLIANYLETRGDTAVFVETGSGRGIWSVPIDQVQKLETSVGLRSGYRPYMAKGALIGAGGGAVGGLLFAASFHPSDPTRKYSRPLTAGIGAAIGAVAGAVVGSRFRVEQWTKVPMPRRLSVLPGSHRGVRVALSF